MCILCNFIFMQNTTSQHVIAETTTLLTNNHDRAYMLLRLCYCLTEVLRAHENESYTNAHVHS